MEIILIHGEYSSKSYQRLQVYIKRAREKDLEILRYEKDSLQNFREFLSQQGLFSQKRLFVVEDLSSLSTGDLNWLGKSVEKLEGFLLLCSQDQVKSRQIDLLPNLKKNEEFKIPKSIFVFLNSFYPKNAKNCLIFLHELLNFENQEFLFYMLSKQVRDLYWSKVSPSSIPYPSWRVERLERQAMKFSKEKLEEIINELSKIDIKAKTSQGSLIDLLDLLITTRLE